MEFLRDLLYAVIAAAVPVATAFVCKWLAEKAKELKLNIKTREFDDTINAVEILIANSVRATTQTYVDNLKKENLFDVEAQKTAFEKTKNAILSQLTEDSKSVITAVYGDLNTYLTNMIEAQVKEQKE